MRIPTIRLAIICLALISTCTLSACSTVTPEQRLQMDRSRCYRIGFPDNSVAMAECVQRYELDRRADGRARQEALDRWMYDRRRMYDWPYYRPHYGYRHGHRSW